MRSRNRTAQAASQRFCSALSRCSAEYPLRHTLTSTPSQNPLEDQMHGLNATRYAVIVDVENVELEAAEEVRSGASVELGCHSRIEGVDFDLEGELNGISDVHSKRETELSALMEQEPCRSNRNLGGSGGAVIVPISSPSPTRCPAHAPQPDRGISEKSWTRLKAILWKQEWFTMYKKLLVLSVATNGVMLALAVRGRLAYSMDKAASFAVANILAVVLVRSEAFLRCVFWLAVKLLGRTWMPLRVKTIVTSFLQSIGGIHSGCGLSAVMWLCYSISERVRSAQGNSRHLDHYTLGVGIAILALLLVSCVAAFPVLRHLHHNCFERLHRFAGWTSLLLLWAFIFLSSGYDSRTDSFSSVAAKLLKRQELWYTTVITLLILLPWLGVRKVDVKTIVPPLRNNTLVYFPGGVKPGLLARISRCPLSEWHAFGIISDGEESHAVIAGAVGDFTRALVENPPQHVWVRGIYFAGLPFLGNLYNRVLMVATGSGIGVFMSFILQPTKAEVHVIWIARNVQDSYGDEIFQAVKNAPTDRVTLIDTAQTGRPRTRELVVQKARDWGAEVVIVSSNPVGSREIVSACQSDGIPAFGPIWDS